MTFSSQRITKQLSLDLSHVYIPLFIDVNRFYPRLLLVEHLD